MELPVEALPGKLALGSEENTTRIQKKLVFKAFELLSRASLSNPIGARAMFITRPLAFLPC